MHNDGRTLDDALRDIRSGAIPANLNLDVAIAAHRAVRDAPANVQYRALRSVFLSAPANVAECRERMVFFDSLPAETWKCFAGKDTREAVMSCLRSEIAMRLAD